MKILENILRAVPAPATPAMIALRECLAAREEKRLAVEAERAKLKRLEDVAQVASDAARKAREARTQADAARQRWIASGCNYPTAREHHELEQAALSAQRDAELAASDSSAVTKTLPAARDALRWLEIQLRGWDDSIDRAVQMCLIEESAELFERGHRLAEEYRAWRREVKALEAAVAPEDFRNATYESRKAAAVVERALERATIKTWYEERDDTRGWERFNDEPEPIAARLKERTAHYLARAAQILREARQW